MLNKEQHEKMQEALKNGFIFKGFVGSEITQIQIDNWFNGKKGYYKERFLSASFLKYISGLENPSFMEKKTTNEDREKRFSDGKLFEAYVCGEFTEQDENPNLRALANKVVSIFPMLPNSKQQSIFKSEIDGYKVKCKTDFETIDKIYELKSTNAKTIKAYENNHISFMYDMQAYIQFTLSGKKVVFVIASKVNHNVFLYNPNYKLGEKQFKECVMILEKYNLNKEFLV